MQLTRPKQPVIAVKNEYVDAGLAEALQTNRTYEFDQGSPNFFV